MKSMRQKSTMGESNRWSKAKRVESILITDRNSVLKGNTKIKEDEHS